MRGRIVLNLFFLFFRITPLLACESYEAFLQKAESLPSQGTLKETASGYVYVEVDEAYIKKLLPLAPGFSAPFYEEYPGFHGAHITVIVESEILSPLRVPQQKVSFQITGYRIIKPPLWKNEALILDVVSEDLDRLRALYHLPPPHYSYHITVGMRPCTLRAEKGNALARY